MHRITITLEVLTQEAVPTDVTAMDVLTKVFEDYDGVISEASISSLHEICPTIEQDDLVKMLPFGTKFSVLLDEMLDVVQHPLEARPVTPTDFTPEVEHLIEEFYCFDTDDIEDSFVEVPAHIMSYYQLLDEMFN